MNYATLFLLGVVVGLSLNVFLPSYLSKRKKVEHSAALATKEDIQEISKEIEEVKHTFEEFEHQNDELLEAEQEFYDSKLEQN